MSNKKHNTLDDRIKAAYPLLYKYLVAEQKTWTQLGKVIGFDYEKKRCMVRYTSEDVYVCEKRYKRFNNHADAFMEFLKHNEYKHDLWML